jgi:hypothetical protein
MYYKSYKSSLFYPAVPVMEFLLYKNENTNVFVFHFKNKG